MKMEQIVSSTARSAAASRIAACFYTNIENAIMKGLTNVDEVFNNRTLENETSGIVNQNDIMEIIKKIHGATISNLRTKYVHDFIEIVNDYMNDLSKKKMNFVETYRFDAEAALYLIGHRYRTHAKLVSIKIFERYQDTISKALNERLNALQKNQKISIQDLIKHLVFHVESSCREIVIDSFHLSEIVMVMENEKIVPNSCKPSTDDRKSEKTLNQFTVKRETSGNEEHKTHYSCFIDLTLSDDEGEAEEEPGRFNEVYKHSTKGNLGQKTKGDLHESNDEVFGRTKGNHILPIESSSTHSSRDISSRLFPYSHSRAKASIQTCAKSVSADEEEFQPEPSRYERVIEGSKMQRNPSASDEDSIAEEDEGSSTVSDCANAADTLTCSGPIKKRKRESNALEEDTEEDRKENLPLDPPNENVKEMNIDQILKAAIDLLIDHFRNNAPPLSSSSSLSSLNINSSTPELFVLLAHCEEKKEELQKVLRAGMPPHAQDLLLDIVNGRNKIQFDNYDSLRSVKPTEYPSVMMTLFHHSKEQFQESSSKINKTGDAAYISASKQKSNELTNHLRKYSKLGKKYTFSLRSSAGFGNCLQNFSKNFLSEHEKRFKVADQEDEVLNSVYVFENPSLTIRIWKLYSRMEKMEFFSLRKDISARYNNDINRFKLAFCRFVKCIFMLICWTIQNDKKLNEDIRQTFGRSRPPIGLNYDTGYARPLRPLYTPKSQKVFKGKGSKMHRENIFKPKDTRTKEEKEWDKAQRREATLKRYETTIAELLGEGTEAKIYDSNCNMSVNVYLSKEKRIHFTPSSKWFQDKNIRATDTIQVRLRLGEELCFLYDHDEDEDDEDFGFGGELVVRKKIGDDKWKEYPYHFTPTQERSIEVIREIIDSQKMK